jgi:alpha-ketoglutarate-dependent 2,4-dichlorophenoxyacetate dioxygenase
MAPQVRQLHPYFMGEVSGVDLAVLTDEQVAQIDAAIDRHAVLVFHGQRLDDDGLLALGRRFGPIEPPRTPRGGHRLKHGELADISNLNLESRIRDRDDRRRIDGLGNQLWHADASFRRVPGALSMLYAHVVPPSGGETEFADLRAA